MRWDSSESRARSGAEDTSRCIYLLRGGARANIAGGLHTPYVAICGCVYAHTRQNARGWEALRSSRSPYFIPGEYTNTNVFIIFLHWTDSPEQLKGEICRRDKSRDYDVNFFKTISFAVLFIIIFFFRINNGSMLWRWNFSWSELSF